MKKPFIFPTFIETYPTEKRILKLSREYLRYYLRKMWCRSQCVELVSYLNQTPLWAELFRQNSYRVNTLLHTYCHKHFGKQQRLQAIKTNFILAEQIFGSSLCSKLIKKQNVCLIKLSDELNLYLSINHIDPTEGFFALNIQNKHKRHIYDASFTFLSPNKLLISSIQGPSGENSQELVKWATKQLYGVRPMFMLINLFKLFCQKLNLELLGIAHKHQAKYRWNDKTKLLFNYDSFWQENNAIFTKGNYWKLPYAIERKPLEEIPSKKRSMYRKRYELFDKIERHLVSN